MSDRDGLARLLAVQEVDVEILALEERREEVPRRRAEAAREITELEAERDELREATERGRLRRRSLEGELETLRERLERYESQLNQVKTNVAYSALLSEMQGAKREIGSIEDEVLGLMEEREERDRRLEEIDGELERKRAGAREELEALSAEEEEIEARLAELRSRREGVVEAVDDSLYRLYDRLRRRRRFPALVPLRGQACGACYNSLPPQVVREITHEGALHPCEGCGVLVYAERAAAEPAGSAADPTRSG